MAQITETGWIFGDGTLHIPMDRINAFCAANKGCRIIARFDAVAPGSSAAQQSYYYNYVVPTIQQAFREKGERKTEKQTDKFLVEQYPGDKSESEIGLGVDVTEARYLNHEQMFDFLDWLKQYAAENLHVFVDDPRVI